MSDCECLFCNCSCPECGSQHIEVTYKPTFEITNNTQNIIHIRNTGIGLELACQECGAYTATDDFKKDARLDGLQLALWRALDLSDTSMGIDDNNKITAWHTVND